MVQQLNGSQQSDVANLKKNDRFHIHVVNTINGRRRRYSAKKEDEAKAIAKKQSDNNHHAHVYDMEEKDGKRGKRIYTTAPKQKKNT